jgi:hypothetical protein
MRFGFEAGQNDRPEEALFRGLPLQKMQDRFEWLQCPRFFLGPRRKGDAENLKNLTLFWHEAPFAGLAPAAVLFIVIDED